MYFRQRSNQISRDNPALFVLRSFLVFMRLISNLVFFYFSGQYLLLKLGLEVHDQYLLFSVFVQSVPPSQLKAEAKESAKACMYSINMCFCSPSSPMSFLFLISSLDIFVSSLTARCSSLLLHLFVNFHSSLRFSLVCFHLHYHVYLLLHLASLFVCNGKPNYFLENLDISRNANTHLILQTTTKNICECNWRS